MPSTAQETGQGETRRQDLEQEMLTTEEDEELLNQIEARVHALAMRHPDNLRELEAVLEDLVDLALAEHMWRKL